MKLTYDQWLPIFEAFTGARVLDPDGFMQVGQDRATSTYTAAEFMERVLRCTVTWPARSPQ